MSYIKAIGNIVKTVGDVFDNAFTSDEERMKLELKEKAIEADLIKAQLDINKTEAKHKSIFVAGWRPFIGWVGGVSLAYQFIVHPLFCWLLQIMKGYQLINKLIQPPPMIDTGPLMTIVMGMLGVGVMRTFDKLKGTQTDSIRQKERIAKQ